MSQPLKTTLQDIVDRLAVADLHGIGYPGRAQDEAELRWFARMAPEAPSQAIRSAVFRHGRRERARKVQLVRQRHSRELEAKSDPA